MPPTSPPQPLRHDGVRSVRHIWDELPRRLLPWLAVATLAANIGIVITGGAVRLTGSGLGCPTWPRCTNQSFTPVGALGIHEYIEFGNRTLTFVLAAIVGLTWIGAIRRRPASRELRVLATVLLLGIPFQAVMGGITVLTNLNPWLVGIHFMVSPFLIVVAVVFLRRVREPSGRPRQVVPNVVRMLAFGVWLCTITVMYLGTIVTGSGPHAGDHGAARNGMDPATTSQLHADAVFLLIGLTIGLMVAERATHAPRETIRAGTVLFAVELGQGLIGFVQYVAGLPILIVGLHLFGAALVVAAATHVVLTTRTRSEPERIAAY